MLAEAFARLSVVLLAALDADGVVEDATLLEAANDADSEETDADCCDALDDAAVLVGVELTADDVTVSSVVGDGRVWVAVTSELRSSECTAAINDDSSGEAMVAVCFWALMNDAIAAKLAESTLAVGV